MSTALRTTSPGRRLRAVTPGRLVLAALVALAVVLFPTAAFAKFTDSGAGTLSAGSAVLAAPSTLAATGECPSQKDSGYATVTFPNVARADGYTVVLDPPTGSNLTRSTTSGTVGVAFTLARKATGTYKVTVTAELKNWTSAPLVRTFTC